LILTTSGKEGRDCMENDTDKRPLWNGISILKRFDSTPLSKEQMEYAVCFLEESSDFEKEEWSRVLLRRIAVTIRREILNEKQ